MRIFFPRNTIQYTNQSSDPENGPVHVECSMMINVMASATEADLEGLFENFQKTTSRRMSLSEMVHQQKQWKHTIKWKTESLMKRENKKYPQE